MHTYFYSGPPVHTIPMRDNQACDQIAIEGNLVAARVDTLKGHLVTSRTIVLENFVEHNQKQKTFNAAAGCSPLQISSERCFFSLQLFNEQKNDIAKHMLGVLSLDDVTEVETPYFVTDLSVKQSTGVTIGVNRYEKDWTMNRLCF